MEDREIQDHKVIEGMLELEHSKIKAISYVLLAIGCILLIFGLALFSSLFESLYIIFAILYIIAGILGIQSLHKNQRYLLVGLKACTVLLILAHFMFILYFSHLLFYYIVTPLDCSKYRGLCKFNKFMTIILAGLSLFGIVFLLSLEVLLLFYLKTIKAYFKGIVSARYRILQSI
jgi:hypothetical protein